MFLQKKSGKKRKFEDVIEKPKKKLKTDKKKKKKASQPEKKKQESVKIEEKETKKTKPQNKTQPTKNKNEKKSNKAESSGPRKVKLNINWFKTMLPKNAKVETVKRFNSTKFRGKYLITEIPTISYAPNLERLEVPHNEIQELNVSFSM